MSPSRGRRMVSTAETTSPGGSSAMPSDRSSSRMSGPLRRCRNLLSLSENVASTMRPLYGAAARAQARAGWPGRLGGRAGWVAGPAGGPGPRGGGWARAGCRAGSLSSAGMDVTLIVDGANVMGSRADGWWRDRAGAMARLHGELAALAARGVRGPVPGDPAGPGDDASSGGATGDSDGPAAGVDAAAGRWDPQGILVVGGRARGGLDLVSPGPAVRVGAARGDGGGEVARLAGRRVVITADRELRRRSAAAGAAVTGPSWLIRQFG